MKKTLILFAVILLPLSVLAANTEKTQIQRRGLRVTPRNVDELKASIKSRKERFEKEREGMEGNKALIYENQDRLRSGAQNLMIMENMLGRTGREISDLSMSLNNLSNDSLKYEEEFSKRGGIKKFFFGQKKDIKENFSKNIAEREDKILKLKELYNKCDCDEDVRQIFEEQITNIEDEQNRLDNYFKKETKRKGILRWLINIFS